MQDATSRVLLVSVLVLASCRDRAPAATSDAGSSRDAAPSALTEEACLDAWLAARDLDPYGSPVGTVYAGGDPLFDETSGRAMPRIDYVYSRHPHAARACGHMAKDGGKLRRDDRPGRQTP
jgi:hypothetical protein